MRYVSYKSNKEWRPGRLLIATKEVSLEYYHPRQERNSIFDGFLIEKGTPALVLKVTETVNYGCPVKAKILLLIGTEIFVLEASDHSYGIPFEPINKRIYGHTTTQKR